MGRKGGARGIEPPARYAVIAELDKRGEIRCSSWMLVGGVKVGSCNLKREILESRLMTTKKKERFTFKLSFFLSSFKE